MVTEEKVWLLEDDPFSTRGPAEQACGLLGTEEREFSGQSKQHDGIAAHVLSLMVLMQKHTAGHNAGGIQWANETKDSESQCCDIAANCPALKARKPHDSTAANAPSLTARTER